MFDFQVLQTKTYVDDRYEIVDLIGGGGMGAIYKALEKDLGRIVALKLLHSTLLEDTEDVARFEREAAILSGLSHRNIALVYRFALWNQTPYIAMEYLEGKSLASELAEISAMTPARVLKIGRQIAEGLEHTHSRGIVHRDIKPHNLILLAKPEPDFVKIVDFGLARLVPSAPNDGTNGPQTLTRTGVLIGSAQYMSPEQCLGDKADARSDVYSLGCVLYECLSGRPPFCADNPIALLHLHVNEQPVGLTRLCSQKLPAGLESVIFRCLAKQPVDRYQSMSELLVDLDLVGSGAGSEIPRTAALHAHNSAPGTRPSRSPIWLVAFAIACGVSLALTWYVDPLLASAVLVLQGNSDRQKLNAAEWLTAQKREPVADLILERVKGGKVAATKLLISQRRYSEADKLLSKIMVESSARLQKAEYSNRPNETGSVEGLLAAACIYCLRGLSAEQQGDLKRAIAYQLEALNHSIDAAPSSPKPAAHTTDDLVTPESVCAVSLRRLATLLAMKNCPKLSPSIEAALNQICLRENQGACPAQGYEKLLLELAARRQADPYMLAQIYMQLASTLDPADPSADQSIKYLDMYKTVVPPDRFDQSRYVYALRSAYAAKLDWRGLVNKTSSFALGDQPAGEELLLQALIELGDLKRAEQIGLEVKRHRGRSMPDVFYNKLMQIYLLQGKVKEAQQLRKKIASLLAQEIELQEHDSAFSSNERRKHAYTRGILRYALLNTDVLLCRWPDVLKETSQAPAREDFPFHDTAAFKNWTKELNLRNAVARSQLGDISGAWQVLDGHTRDASYMKTAALIKSKEGHFEEALKMANTAFSPQDSSAQARVLASLSMQICIDSGKKDEAIKYAKEVLRLAQSSDPEWLASALFLQKNNQP